jgi:hypothetical protein
MDKSSRIHGERNNNYESKLVNVRQARELKQNVSYDTIIFADTSEALDESLIDGIGQHLNNGGTAFIPIDLKSGDKHTQNQLYNKLHKNGLKMERGTGLAFYGPETRYTALHKN